MSVMTMTAVSPERLNGEGDEFLERSLCLCTYMQHSFRGWKDIPEAGLARNPEAPMCGSLSNLLVFGAEISSGCSRQVNFFPDSVEVTTSYLVGGSRQGRTKVLKRWCR